MAHRLSTSIRWRLLVWLAVLLAALVSGFGVTTYRLIGDQDLRELDAALARRLAAAVTDVRGPMPAPPPTMPDRAMPQGMRPPDRPSDLRATPPSAGQPGGAGQSAAEGAELEQRPPELPANDLPDQARMDPRQPMAGGPPFSRDGPAWPPGNRPGPRTVKLSTETRALFDAMMPERPYCVWWLRDSGGGNAGAAPAGLERPLVGRGDGLTHFRSRVGHREAFFLTEFGDCVLVGQSLAPHEATMRYLAWWLALAGVAVLSVGAGGGWLIVNRALRPVAQIGATAARIATGKLDERIDVSESESELGQLAAVLNDTFARLERAFAEQKRFTADASHELRTPLAVIIAEAQTTLKRERDAGEYREALVNCLEAAQQMRRLADMLLELARFDAGQEFLRKGEGDLAAVVRSCADLVRPLADARGIRLECELEATPLCADFDRLARLTTNLLDNAIYYNRDGGVVWVRTWAEEDAVLLTVEDSGCGIAPEDLPRVFERFYRADKSRSIQRQRHGLGLAICKAIVDAHGGTITVESTVGEGTTFRVRLPRTAAAAASPGLG